MGNKVRGQTVKRQEYRWLRNVDGLNPIGQ